MVPKSFVFGTPDRNEAKNVDFVIHFMYKLRGTVQVIDPELPELELDTPQTTQSADKRARIHNAAGQWAKSISDVTGSGVAYTEQDVTQAATRTCFTACGTLDARTRSIL